MPKTRYFHLHLISDATGETLLNVGRAAAAQYSATHAIEHVHSLVRTPAQIDRIAADLEEAPGIVLYTLVDSDLSKLLEQKCRDIGVPCVSVLELCPSASGITRISENRIAASKSNRRIG